MRSVVRYSKFGDVNTFMATNDQFDWRSSDRRVYAAVATFFVFVVLLGFGRTYYFRYLVNGPAVPTILVHLHGLVMTLWVAFFVSQVWLIRTKRAKVHMNMGMLGIALAIVVIVVGFFTGAAAAKNGSTSAPPDISPLSFFIVPFFDIVLFAAFFAAAIYFRKRLADHKRLMLITVINFLPPAVARIPIPALQAFGPLFFFGIPAFLALGFLIYDTVKNGKLNKPFAIGAAILIASYPLRLMVSESNAWLSFASWITGWAA